MTNYATPHNNGFSTAFHADGSLIVQAGGQEGIYIAPFDLESLRTYRQREPWGNAFRKPHLYQLLTSPLTASK